MKTTKFLSAVIGMILLSAVITANDYREYGDDTIRIKTKDNSEMILIINEFDDFNGLSLEVESVMNSLEDVLFELESELENLDSVINVNVKNIDNEIVIDIKGVSDNEDKIINLNYDMNDEPRKERTLHGFMTYDFGFNNYLENGKFPNDVNAQYAAKPWGSWNFAIGGGLRWYFTKPVSIDIAADFSWYNFKYQDRSTRVNKTDDDIVFSTDALGAEYIKSKTSVPYLNVSLIPMVHFGAHNSGVNHRDFRLGLGVYAGYRLGGSVKYVYEVDNVKMKYHNTGDYFLNTYRYGVKAVLGYADVNVFASYDLSTLYAEGKGPALNPICFGLNFTF
ncbi:MAG: hypothetical protein PHH30_00130 [Bacteroidales bacterium]|nr:hypothetical protein [Bacteroidales bacterium]MDD3859950.1 hypothetical protein [Bacteroidales bacterium]